MNSWWTKLPTWRVGITVRFTSPSAKADKHGGAYNQMGDLIQLFRALGIKYQGGEWLERPLSIELEKKLAALRSAR